LRKGIVSGMVFTLLLAGILPLAFNVQVVKGWAGTIYIKADGSIFPSDAPMVVYYNVIYTLTDNITSSGDGIIVEKDNIIIDGAGYTLVGSEVDYKAGIVLAGVENVLVNNVQISQFYYGIWINSASNNTVSGNSMTLNTVAVFLDYASNNIISGNNLTYNSVGVIFESSSNNNTISGNNITNNWDGIRLDHSSYNVISENNITNIHKGLFLDHSSNNTISKNEITYNENGIRLRVSSHNVISRNNIVGNDYGVVLDDSFDNTISGNNMVINTYSMWLYAGSSNNKVYHNNFINNANPIDTGKIYNVWDGGYPSGGNYWNDYSDTDVYSGPYQNEDGADAIGDSPYVIDGSNVDNYPLMGPFRSFVVFPGYLVDTVCNSTVEDLEYFQSNRTIVMHVSNRTKDQTMGFCRLAIPHKLMAPPYNITIDNNQVDYRTIFENETLSIIYFSYEHSKLEIIIIPEFPSATILPLFMIFFVIAVVLAKKKHAGKVKT